METSRIRMKANKYVTRSEDDSRDKFLGNFRVLGDVTNCSVKRRFPLTPGEPVLENEKAYGKITDGKLEDTEFRRRVCEGVENLVLEKENTNKENFVLERENANQVLIGSESVTVSDGKKYSSLKAKRLCRSMNLGNSSDESAQDSIALDVSEAPIEIRELPRSLNCNLHLLRGDAMMHAIMEGDESRDSCISSAYLPGLCDKVMSFSPILGESQDDYRKISSDIMTNAVETDAGDVSPVMDSHEKSDKGKHVAGHGQFVISSACNLQIVGSQESKTDGGESLIQAPLDKWSSSACLGETGCFGSKMFGFEGSANMHVSCSGDGGFNNNDCFDSDKTCSCPFCLKAAYLWSVLHYQDARDRLAALKKSRKQVRQLVSSYNHNEPGKIAHEGFDRSTKMELNLMHQWRSLFIHTEDVLVRESNRLQSNILKLKDLKENCERDLEMIIGAPSDKS